MNDERIAYSIEEAARATGLSRRGLYVLIARGELETAKVGRRRLVPARALEDLIERATRDTRSKLESAR